MKFSQNMHEIQTDTKKKPQASVTSRDNDIKVLRFFVRYIFNHQAKGLFFSCQKAWRTDTFSLRTEIYFQDQLKGKSHAQEKSHGAATYMKVTMKVSIYRCQLIWHAL
jgi:hypothetical protein